MCNDKCFLCSKVIQITDYCYTCCFNCASKSHANCINKWYENNLSCPCCKYKIKDIKNANDIRSTTHSIENFNYFLYYTDNEVKINKPMHRFEFMHTDGTPVVHNNAPTGYEIKFKNETVCKIPLNKWFKKYDYSKVRNNGELQLCCYNIDKINLHHICLLYGHYAMQLCRENISKVDWSRLSYNECPEAMLLCRENIDKIDWYVMSKRTDDEAIQLCRENIDNVDWRVMSSITLCRENIEKVNWKLICRQNDDEFVNFCKENVDKIDWSIMCNNTNEYAVKLCLDNIEKVINAKHTDAKIKMLNCVINPNTNIEIKNKILSNVSLGY